MFLSKAGEYEPCGIYNEKHLILFLCTLGLIFVAVKNTKIANKDDVRKIIIKSTIIVWILEILKTIFTISIGKGREINKIVPLYYCSLLLYSGLLSSFGKGMFKRTGDVFLATGAIIAGIVFIIYPSTSLPDYPMLHFISIHSFFFHGTMIYLGIIINKYKYIELEFSDIKYYATLILLLCIPAYVLNKRFGSNLMFISQDFPGTPLSGLYHSTGKLFTPLNCLVQMTLPFIFMWGILRLKDFFGEISKKHLKNP